MSMRTKPIFRFRSDPWLLAVLFFLALGLRVSRPDLMEWKHDEAVAWVRARAMLTGLAFPRTGLVSSQGLENFPLFVWLIALFQIVCRAPETLIWPIASINSVAVLLLFDALRRLADRPTARIAAILYTVSPCAIFFSRKIWAQDLMPFWSCALFWCATRMVESQSAGKATADPFHPSLPFALLAATSFQVHFSAAFLCLAYGAASPFYWRALRLGPLVVGAAFGLFLALPYLGYQSAHGWQGLSVARDNLYDGARWRLRDTGLYFLRQCVDENFHGMLGSQYRAFLAGLPGYRAVRYGLSALTLAGLAGLCARAAYGTSESRRMNAFPLLLACAGLAALGLMRLPLHPSYFIIFYPIPFYLAALALARLGKIVERRCGQGIATIGLVATCLSIGMYQITYCIMFLLHVADRGGTVGDYGASYAQTRAASRWLSAEGPPTARWKDVELPLLACAVGESVSPPAFRVPSNGDDANERFVLSRLLYPRLDSETEAWVVVRMDAYYGLMAPAVAGQRAVATYPQPALGIRQELEAAATRELALEMMAARSGH